MQGILLLDKPLGLSSNAALQRVRHVFGKVKAGHAGTLDPLATGMLPIYLGEATKFIGYALHGRKAYVADVCFGSETSTADREGKVVAEAPLPAVDEAGLRAALARFVGTIRQTPPMYSAIKRDGVPLYRLARQGETVDVPERSVVIESIDLLGHSDSGCCIRVVCGAGTYIRSLAVDLGRALGSAAHLAGLRRIWVDPYADQAMHMLDAVLADQDRSARVLPIESALPPLPAVHLDRAQTRAICHGQNPAVASESEGLFRAYGDDRRFLGLVHVEAGSLRVERLLATA